MRGFFRSFKKMKTAPFGKREKLKSRKQIETLFAGGKSFAVSPVRVKYQILAKTDTAVAVQAGVSLSRRSFKRAVDRNRLKRLLREAYRLQKTALLQSAEEKERCLALFFIYTSKSIAPFEVIYTAMTQCLSGLQQKLTLHHESNR